VSSWKTAEGICLTTTTTEEHFGGITFYVPTYPPLAAISCALALTAPATAGIIDYVPTRAVNASQQVAANDPLNGNVWTGIAQSFTAQDASMRFTFYAGNFTPGSIYQYLQLTLYSGEGASQSLMQQTTVPVNLASYAQAPVTADFSSAILTPGQRYTVVASLPSQSLPAPGTSSDISLVYNSINNAYPDGRFYFVGGSYAESLPAFANRDLAFRVTPGDCANAIQSAVSVGTSNAGQEMRAVFRPNFGLTLDQAAGACGLMDFNWQQTITKLPDPSPFYLSDGTHLTSASTPFLDPPVGGYTYRVSTSFPYYFNAYNGELDKFETKYTLYFSDAPGNSCLPGGTGAGCGGVTAPAGSVMEFRTQLVGIRSDGTFVLLPNSWVWTDSFNGTSGGVDVTNNLMPLDPGSGTGGITILDTTDVVVTPEPGTFWVAAVAFALLTRAAGRQRGGSRRSGHS
jgi:hypothetical protein